LGVKVKCPKQASGSRSNRSHRPPQHPLPHFRINLRRSNLPVVQRPLDEVQVAGFLVQSSGESMAEGVQGNWPVDPGFLKPPREPVLKLFVNESTRRHAG
jgi:hypothetical protein